MNLFFFFVFFLFYNVSFSEEKFFFSVCSIFKNEKAFLKEWIEYHRLIGVDHFYLYSNDSTDFPRSVLAPYIRSGEVTLIYWPDIVKTKNREKWAVSTQITAYENATYFQARTQTKWLTFLDIDEFILPVGENDLIAILKEHDDAPAITLSSDCFNATIDDQIPQKKLAIESTQLVQPPKKLVKKVEKTIFKPAACQSFYWPPFKYKFKHGQKAVIIDRSNIRINQYINRNVAYLNQAKIKDRISINQNISRAEISDLLQKGYEIEDHEKAIYRYIPELYKRMGY